MFDLQHTTALAIGVLDGDAMSHKILADLLEEMGDRQNAEFARSDKKKPRKRLDLALGLLPMFDSLRLSCDFCEHAQSSNPALFERLDDLVGDVIPAVRQWCDAPENTLAIRCELTREQLQRFRNRRMPLRPMSRDQDRRNMVAKHFELLIDNYEAVHATLEKRQKDELEERAPSRRCVDYTRRIGDSARTIVSQRGRYAYRDRNAWRLELEWQIDRTRELLEGISNA